MPENGTVEEPQFTLERVMGDVAIEDTDKESVIRHIAGKVLQADTLAAVFADDKTMATREAVGLPLRITDATLVKSNLEDSRGTYMLIEATRRDTNEEIILNTGSPKIMAMIGRCKDLGKLPIECSVQEAAIAEEGRDAPLTLLAEGETAEAVSKETAKSKR